MYFCQGYRDRSMHYKLRFKITQGGRGHWAVYNSSPQSLTMFSHLLGTFIEFWLVGLFIECLNVSITNCNLQEIFCVSSLGKYINLLAIPKNYPFSILKLLGESLDTECYFVQSNHNDIIINPKTNEWLNEFINSIGKFYLQFIVPTLPAF